jgi:hypothetical protein
MAVTNEKSKAEPTEQKACIDLPGQPVTCWRSSDNIQVILRKHRDIFFELNLQPGMRYTIESNYDFYSPKDKKLLRRLEFSDGERCHIWVGREFKGKLILKVVGEVLGTYEVNQLDTKVYDADPKIKPEPLMVIMGRKEVSGPFMCTADDPFGTGSVQKQMKASFESKAPILKSAGTEFDYILLDDPPDVKEYVAVTDALPSEIQPQIIDQLERNVAVVGNASQIFNKPQKNQESLLLTALFTAAKYISGNAVLTGSTFKESAGYLVEHFHALDKIFSSVRIEKKAKGAYRVAIKGHPVSQQVAKLFGAASNTQPSHWNYPLGSKQSAFLVGGYARTGRSGYGGFKRIMMTSRKNFVAGMKVQVIGTVIDLIVDAHTVFGDEHGSRDISEFLGRAGVSILKAGATAVLGNALAALGTAALTAMVGVGALPVGIVVLIVVAGFIGAAMLIDMVDDGLGIKKSVAEWAR